MVELHKAHNHHPSLKVEGEQVENSEYARESSHDVRAA